MDYLGSQGLWVCSAIGVLSLAVLAFVGKPILGLLILVLYYLRGWACGGSRYAGGWAFVIIFARLSLGAHVVKLLVSALLLSNFERYGSCRGGSRIRRRMRRCRGGARRGAISLRMLAGVTWPRLWIVYYILSVG